MLNLSRAGYLTTTLTTGALLATAFGASLTPAAWAQPAAKDGKIADNRPIRELKTVDLATFHLANGNEVRIIGVPEEDDIMVGEIIDAGANERFVIEPKTPPAEVFRRLAPKNSPVPRMIAKTDDKKVLAGRKLVEALDKPVQVATDQLGIQLPPKAAAAGAGSCQAGAAGAAYFLAHHCGSDGGPGYGKREPHCYKDAADWIDKTSNSRSRATYARMASCGSGMNRMRHFYGTVSGWDTQVNVYVDPQKVIDWWSYKKGVKRYRRVRFEEHQPAGWVRGWMVFWSEVAGGW
jgi:hypothetical protein